MGYVHQMIIIHYIIQFHMKQITCFWLHFYNAFCHLIFVSQKWDLIWTLRHCTIHFYKTFYHLIFISQKWECHGRHLTSLDHIISYDDNVLILFDDNTSLHISRNRILYVKYTCYWTCKVQQVPFSHEK